MKSIFISLLLFAFISTNAQDNKAFVPSAMPSKGSKVFIECDNEKEERVLPHLIDRIEKWGYWVNVNNKEQADFIIEQVVPLKGGGVKGFVILKKLDGTEIARSKTVKAKGDPSNGFSAWRGFSIGIGRWLKGEK